MDLHYDIKQLNEIETRVNRSIKALETNGIIIGDEHYLSVVRKLVGENKALRDEVVRKNSNES